MVLHRAARNLAIVMRPDLRFASETRAELLGNKERLLSNGDRWASLLSKRLDLDAPCRPRWSSVL